MVIKYRLLYVEYNCKYLMNSLKGRDYKSFFYLMCSIFYIGKIEL